MKLSEINTDHFERLERVIESGKQTFVSVGLALEQIRQEKLYRNHYSTFEEYCQKRWGWNAQRGRQLINSALVVESVTKEIGTMVPISERAARELSNIPPEIRASVVNQAAVHGPITAKSIVHAAEENVKEKAAAVEIVRDKSGYPVPERAMALWNRSDEVMQWLQLLGKLKGVLTTAQKDDDVLWRSVNFSSTIAELQNVGTGIKEAMPYAVCTSCQGQISKNCTLCKGRGFLSKFSYEHCIAEEVRNFRKKACQ